MHGDQSLRAERYRWYAGKHCLWTYFKDKLLKWDICSQGWNRTTCIFKYSSFRWSSFLFETSSCRLLRHRGWVRTIWPPSQRQVGRHDRAQKVGRERNETTYTTWHAASLNLEHITRNESKLLYYKMKLSVFLSVFLSVCLYPNIWRTTARTALKQTAKIR